MNQQHFITNFGIWPCDYTDVIPNEPGVYVILVMTCGRNFIYETLYIGSTSNLRKRLYNHEVLREFSKYKLRVHFIVSSNYKEHERIMIKHHSPLANKHHNMYG